MRTAETRHQPSLGKRPRFSLITPQYGLTPSSSPPERRFYDRNPAYRQSYSERRASPYLCFASWFPSVQRVSSYHPLMSSEEMRQDRLAPTSSTLTKSTCRPQRRIIPCMRSRTSFTQLGMHIFIQPLSGVFVRRVDQLGPFLTRIPTLETIDSIQSGVVRKSHRGSALRRPMIVCCNALPTSEDEKLRLRAMALYRVGELSKACDLLRKSIKAQPENGRAWQDLAKVEGKRQKSTKASAVLLKRALKFNSRNPYLWQSLGFYLWRLRKHDAARDSFEKGILADPSHSSLYTTYARLEFEQGNTAKARELFEKGGSAGAADARLFHSWGVMEMKLGSMGRARSLFRKGLTIDKQNPFIWHSLAEIAKEEGDIDGARICNENALNTGRSGVAVFDALAKLEAHEGNDGLARNLFSKGATAFPDDVRILHSWSLFEYQRGKLSEAKRLIQRALRKNSKDSFLWTHYAKIEEARENYPLARSLFKRACTLCAQDWRAWDQWSAMEHKLGNYRESETLLRESFRIRFKAKGAFTILANSIHDKY